MLIFCLYTSISNGVAWCVELACKTSFFKGTAHCCMVECSLNSYLFYNYYVLVMILAENEVCPLDRFDTDVF